MSYRKKITYFKTHRSEDMDKIFFNRPTKKWIESKLLPCFDLTSLDDNKEVTNELKEITISRIEELTNEITKYLQLVVVKRSFCRYENTFYKCIIILKYFANLYDYTIKRRVEYTTPYTTKIHYSLININLLEIVDYADIIQRKKYTYKPLLVLPEQIKCSHMHQQRISIAKIRPEFRIISFD